MSSFTTTLAGWLPALVLSSTPNLVQTGEQAADTATPIREAWHAWEAGEVQQAHQAAQGLAELTLENDEAEHILFLTSFVSGCYEEALGHFERIDESYARRSELDKLVIDAQLHLGRYADAERFARKSNMPTWRVTMLGELRLHPLRVTLTDLTIVPFASHPLTAYFPAFDAQINRKPTVVHVDTGGTFLVMGPDRAKELGIGVKEAGKGFHGPTETDLYKGLAKRFQLGAAVLENVPVGVLPTLTGHQDFVIFGTNVLQQFLSTLDYPGGRLILSPKGNATWRAKHMNMLPPDRTRVPFFMWGDHYMFARGAVGAHENLNFFIDSGLVSLHPSPKGGLQQAAFSTSRERLLEWGIPEDEVAKNVIQLPVPLSLGPLKQEGILVVPGKVGTSPFGGVRMDGLLSHAFLKEYAWTLDFENREYVFSMPK